jgi:hypothetical protein
VRNDARDERRRKHFMKRRLIAPMLGAALLTGTAAFACPGKHMSFEALDTDGNGGLTAEEFTAGAQARAAEKFSRIDGNADGVITKEEMEAAHQAFRERHMQRRNSSLEL